MEEVERAISELKNGKSPGLDDLPSELMKLGGRQLCNLVHKLCVTIWQQEEWPDDFVRSAFVIIPKKGHTENCENN